MPFKVFFGDVFYILMNAFSWAMPATPGLVLNKDRNVPMLEFDFPFTHVNIVS